MNEWLKKMIDKTKEFWKNSSIVKKVILIGIIVAIIGAIVVATNVSSKPTTVKLFNAAVTDETLRSQILDRISQENIEAFVSDDGYISVLDDKTARKMRSILVTEGLTPSNVDIFEGFYNRSWSTTDKEQNIRLKNLITQNLKMHLESLSDISSANVTLVLPENELFASDQKPVSASVILNIKSSSNLANERKRLLGIQKLILSAVEGLTAENLTISDMDGNVLNDFEGMADMDRVSVIERQQKLRRKLEAQLKADVLIALQKTKTEDRIRDLNVTIDMDMSEKSNESTIYTPIEMKADNKDTPYDESVYVEGLPISQQTVTKEWQGTGYNPEGPAGVEGQNPPVYSDMSNVIGKSTETGVTQNNAVNTTHSKETVAPRPGRVTVSVNVDGTWDWKYDDNGNVVLLPNNRIDRVYTPVSPETLAEATALVQDAIGYNELRGDSVTVRNIRFDRTAEHLAEDAKYIKAQQTRQTIFYALTGVVVVLIAFIIFRFISRELERRRRIKEDEYLRQQQLAREKVLWESEQAGMEVTMSVEERRRAELQENAISMAKDHPEDVAMLIRTWLMEE